MVQEVVRGFLLGLIFGAVLGAGGVYAALERPWQSNGKTASAPRDAGPAAPTKRKRKHRRHRRRTSAYDAPPVLTAADRKLAWKGDAVSMPVKSLDMSAGGSSGRSMNAGEINDTIKSDSDSVIRCIADATGEADLAADVTLKMLVDGNGRVRKMRMRAPQYLFDQGVYRCVRSAAMSMGFPATGDYTVVTAPFTLN